MAPRPLDPTSPHVDPVHEAKYGFCREGCEECDRLDREEYPYAGTPSEKLARGVMLALVAIDGEAVDRE